MAPLGAALENGCRGEGRGAGGEGLRGGTDMEGAIALAGTALAGVVMGASSVIQCICRADKAQRTYDKKLSQEHKVMTLKHTILYRHVISQATLLSQVSTRLSLTFM